MDVSQPCIKNKINRLSKLCLRLIYYEKQLTFKEFLENGWFCLSTSEKSANSRHWDVESREWWFSWKYEGGFQNSRGKRILFQVSKDLQTSYNKFSLQRQRNYFAFGAWKIKELVSLNGFKKVIKKWKLVNCPSKLCRAYIMLVS